MYIQPGVKVRSLVDIGALVVKTRCVVGDGYGRGLYVSKYGFQLGQDPA